MSELKEILIIPLNHERLVRLNTFLNKLHNRMPDTLMSGETIQPHSKYTRISYITDIHNKSLVSTVKFSPNGKFVATSSTDMTIRIWRLPSLKPYRTLHGHTNGISDIEFSSNSKYLASASDDLTIRIWDLEFGQAIKILKGHTYHINCVKFNKKNTILISGSSDENIRVWDIMRGKCLKILSAHSDPISSLDFSFDCTVIASGSYDGLIRLFDLETGQCLKTLIYDKSGSSFPVSQVKFSPNSKFILSSSLDGVIRLWDYMDNKVVKTFKNSNGGPVAEKYNIGANFITSGDQLMVNSGDELGNIIFWDLQTKEIKFKLTSSESQSPILNVDSYNGGQLLISVSMQGELSLWENNDC